MDEQYGYGRMSVGDAAKIVKKNPQWVRAGIVTGYFPVGIALRNGRVVNTITAMDSKYGRITYFVSPKLFEEVTGIAWKGSN